MPKRTLAREAAQVTVDGAAATAQPDHHADGSKNILVRVSPETWRALEAIASDQDRTLQSIMAEAVDEYLGRQARSEA